MYDQLIRKGVAQAMAESLLLPEEPFELGAPLKVYFKPGFTTACWYFLNNTHRIIIGLGILEREELNMLVEDSALRAYCGAFFHHEQAHALFTARERDKELQDELRAFGCPFKLYNLFEDARIEHLYRGAIRGFSFGWLSVEPQAPLTNALNMFFSLVQNEGKRPPAYDELLPPYQQDFRTVQRFYERACACKDSFDLLELLREWGEVFGLPAQEESVPGFALQGEMLLGSRLAQNPALEGEFLYDAFELSDSAEQDGFEELLPSEVSSTRKSHSLLGSRGPVDEQEAFKVVAQLKKLFRERTVFEKTRSPAKHISARALIRDPYPFRVRNILSKKKKAVVVIVDCSGSMQGHPAVHGRTLVWALSLLAQQGLVSGKVVLSKVQGGQALHSVHELPMMLSEVERIPCDGEGEGLQSAMATNMGLLKKADSIFVYTDAQITDSPISLPSFRRHGIITTGLYCSGARNLPQSVVEDKMREYFDRQIVRGNVEELVKVIVTQALV